MHGISSRPGNSALTSIQTLLNDTIASVSTTATSLITRLSSINLPSLSVSIQKPTISITTIPSVAMSVAAGNTKNNKRNQHGARTGKQHRKQTTRGLLNKMLYRRPRLNRAKNLLSSTRRESDAEMLARMNIDDRSELWSVEEIRLHRTWVNMLIDAGVTTDHLIISHLNKSWIVAVAAAKAAPDGKRRIIRHKTRVLPLYLF